MASLETEETEQAEQTEQTEDRGENGGRPLVTRAMAESVLAQAAADGTDPGRIIFVDGVPYLLDIRFRMLANAELARAMGFDDEETKYEFAGTVSEVTKQIGNAGAGQYRSGPGEGDAPGPGPRSSRNWKPGKPENRENQRELGAPTPEGSWAGGRRSPWRNRPERRPQP